MEASPEVGETARLLAAWRSGDDENLPRLIEVLHQGLRRQAQAQLRRLRPGETLGTTALVNEAFVKMLDHRSAKDRDHFFAVAATAMRQILVDHARAKMAKKRGDGRAAVELDEEFHRVSVDVGGVGGSIEEQAVSLLDLHRALDGLARRSARLAKVVEYRFFGGMTEPQIASVLDVTDRTVRRDWIKARAWLHRELAGPPSTVSSSPKDSAPREDLSMGPTDSDPAAPGPTASRPTASRPTASEEP
ncbi:MAG: ECF-type sigma factor [Acidobacteriota bacterium]